MLAAHPRGEDCMRKVLAMLVVLSLVMSMFTGVFAPVPKARAATGTITVIKNTVGGEGTFHFTVSDGVYDVSAFDITTGTTTVGQGIYSVPVTAGVAYTVTEDTLPGWVSDALYQTVTVGTVGAAVYFNNTKLTPTPATYTVTYDANGGTGTQTDGSSPYLTGATVTVLDQGSMLYTGYTFSGWNTVAVGGGTAYAAAATFTITADTILYAQWTITPTPPVVTPPVVTPPVVTPPVVTPPV